MLPPEIVTELNEFRRAAPGESVCPAPAINLHFSQLGVVTACCFNRQHVLGVYPKDSLHDIWYGEPVRELRAALDRYDMSKGCEKCSQQIEARDFGGSHAVFYGNYAKITAAKRRELGMQPPGDPIADPMPMRLEFNIHNSCNLQCVMCHGLASSAIRTGREGLTALPCPYDDAFVDQLEPFLPYVVETDFMGGEPFLIPVYVKLWERIARINPAMQACILTNGTILDDRIKGILEGFNCWIHVSIDSIYKDTYETIRRGASYEQVKENCDYYVDLMRQRGLSVVFRYCPMRLNWREIPSTVEYCNEKGIMLMYNQVDSPLNLSLHTLPPDELQSVVAYLEARVPADEASDVVHHNRQHYLELIQRLKGFLHGDNRLNGLRARLAVSEAVVGQYTRDRKQKTPELEETNNALVQAAKRYLITRLNVDQARGTEGDLPADVTGALSARLGEMSGLLTRTDGQRFLTTYLNELVRTYSGVWGVVRVHDAGVFQRIAALAAALAARPDGPRSIQDVLEAPPGEVYDALSSRPVDELTELYGGANRSA